MILKKTKNLIKKLRKKKYRNILLKKKDFILRQKAFELIKKLSSSKKKFRKNCKSCSFYINNLNKNNLLIFYEKFSVNLSLKEHYSLKNYKKKTNKKACFYSYIVLSEFIKINKKLNNIQKLNVILKINDLLILLFSKKKHSSLAKYFNKNIIYEKTLTKKYL